MKVCLVTGRMDAGGVPVLLLELMRRTSVSMHIFLAAPMSDQPYGTEARTYLSRGHFISIKHRRFSFKDVIRLAFFLRANGIDLVSCEGKSGGLIGRVAALLARKPVIYFYHGIHYKQYRPAQRLAYFAIERGLSTFSKAIAAVSEDEKQTIIKLGLCPTDKVRLCENGVAGPTIPDPMPSNAGKFRCLHITRFNMQKYSELLLDILEALRKANKLHCFQVVVVGEGEGDARVRYEAEVKRRNLNETVQCVGHVNDVGPLLSSTHCLVSTSRWEGQPLGVLEAMAMARCVVATDVVGHRGTIQSGLDGLLYPDDNALAAAEILIKLKERPLWMNTLALAGRRKWEAWYSIDSLIQRRVRLYKEVAYAM